MKLLILQETDWLKRYPGVQHHLAERMSLRGHEVRVIDYGLLWRAQNTKELYSKRKVFAKVVKIYPDANITVIRPGFIKLPLMDYLSMLISHHREIKRQIKEFRPDVIVGFGILNSYTATRVTKETHIPFVYYWVDVLHLLIPSKAFRFLGEIIERRALKQADSILALNDGLKDLVFKMGAPSERTHVLEGGINLEIFNEDISGNGVRERYGIDGHDVVLFFMGFLYHFSGLKEVAMKLAESDIRLKLFIVGEGDAYEELKRIREKYNLQDRIILAGKKPYPELPSLIAAADICILPAYPWEPIMRSIVPVKLREYMVMKKPVISTSLPGVVREFGNGNGIVYVDKPEDVVDKAIELISNGSLGELGNKARSFAERNSWEKITSEFERLLEEAIKDKAPENERELK